MFISCSVSQFPHKVVISYLTLQPLLLQCSLEACNDFTKSCRLLPHQECFQYWAALQKRLLVQEKQDVSQTKDSEQVFPAYEAIHILIFLCFINPFLTNIRNRHLLNSLSVNKLKTSKLQFVSKKLNFSVFASLEGGKTILKLQQTNYNRCNPTTAFILLSEDPKLSAFYNVYPLSL